MSATSGTWVCCSPARSAAADPRWEELEVTLPRLPASMYWELAADTWQESQPPRRTVEDRFTIHPRSVMVFVAR